jgi:hypothetical protein
MNIEPSLFLELMVPKDNKFYPFDEATISELRKIESEDSIETDINGQKKKKIDLKSLIPLITQDLILLGRSQIDIGFLIMDTLANIGGFIFIIVRIVNYFVEQVNERHLWSMLYKDALKCRESKAFRVSEPKFKKECNACCCVLCNKDKRSSRYRFLEGRKKLTVENIDAEGGHIEMALEKAQFEGGSVKGTPAPSMKAMSVNASLKQSIRVPSVTQAQSFRGSNRSKRSNTSSLRMAKGDARDMKPLDITVF